MSKKTVGDSTQHHQTTPSRASPEPHPTMPPHTSPPPPPPAPIIMTSPSGGISTFQALVVTLLAIITGIQIQSFAATDMMGTSSNLLSTFIRGGRPVNGTGRSASLVVAPAAAAGVEAPRAFDHDDFASYFGLHLIHVMEVDPVIASFVDEHDVTEDELYTSDAVSSDRWRQALGWMLEGGFPNDRRFDIRYISLEKGYGMFAKVDVGSTQVVSVYAGVLTNNSISDYMWSYPSKIYDAEGQLLNLGIDSRFRGNWA
ncbi:hypothetical protein HDU67_008870, partial [Dinochytrium kinnereticum]